ncbi:MAG: hypothetical protein ABIG60_01920 [Patescibacteria group bacterium]
MVKVIIFQVIKLPICLYLGYLRFCYDTHLYLKSEFKECIDEFRKALKIRKK